VQIVVVVVLEPFGNGLNVQFTNGMCVKNNTPIYISGENKQ